MSEKSGPIASVKRFSFEVRQELHKCSWPSWDELRGSTIVVILSVILFAVLVAAADALFKFLLQWIIS